MSLEYTPHAGAAPPNHHPPPRRPGPLQPPLINTALPSSVAPSFGRYGYAQTPASALLPASTPLTALSAQSAFPLRNGIVPAMSPMAYRTPATAVLAYNPQEWQQQSRPMAGSYVPHAPTPSFSRSTGTRDTTGMEATMPSPPPPYSPSPTQTISQNLHSSPHISHGRFVMTQSPSIPQSQFVSEYNSSPPNVQQQSMHHDNSTRTSPTFPPPPGPRDRSTSRTRGKFSLSAFRQKNTDPSSSTTAMDSLQSHTNEVLARLPRQQNSPSPQPPASRRSASTSAVNSTTPSSQRAISQQGGLPMHIPPPPPGPPPTSSRSQSMDRSCSPATSSTPVNFSQIAPPTRRPQVPRSSLGPVPPTPANWTEENDSTYSQPSHHQSAHPLQSNPTFEQEDIASSAKDEHTRRSSNDAPSTPPRPSSSSSYAAGLSRTPATRDNNAKEIRERRNESRTRRGKSVDEPDGVVQDSDVPKKTDFVTATPSDLILSNAVSTDRRRVVSKSTAISSLENGSASAASHDTEFEHLRRASDGFTPAPLNLDTRNVDPQSSQPVYTQTPPFSPDDQKSRLYTSRSTASTGSRGLPTPPLNRQIYQDQSPFTAANGRPSPAQITQINNISFAKESLDRYSAFVDRESAAASEREKLEIFAEFMVHESRIRRDRYSRAFDSLGSNVLDLTRDLWRSLNPTQQHDMSTGSSNASNYRQDAHQSFQSASTPTSATMMSESDLGSPASASSQNPPRAKSPWTGNNFQPCLSPIPSMAMSTTADEQDSRGRSASRWWDASVEGSVTDGGRKIQRSKRESKYMGLPKNQWDASELSPSLPSATPGPSQNFYALGANEYPEEKNGFDQDGLIPPPPPSLPATPLPNQLDVSRLITLPPPYPRHHPAVNNNHPELADVRATLRSISEIPEVQKAKESYSMPESPEEEAQELLALNNARRKQMRTSIHGKIASGEISFAEAAQQEADFEADISKQSLDAVKAEFDKFKKEVMTPLQALLGEKITTATACIDQLRKSLSHDAQNRDPTQTQEEGDEQPELLEKLTILKWVFEAREVLHKELFTLQGQGDQKYSRVILTPYMVSNNTAKMHEVTKFFAADAQQRTIAHEKETYRRIEDFLRIIDANVTRGVEIQLSAFWDIAPPLNALVAKIPANLRALAVLIPAQEYAENAAYYDFPTQYLYSLLEHAGKSAYQFIESQTNLLCLLHEVRTAVAAASCRLLETQRVAAAADAAAAAAAAAASSSSPSSSTSPAFTAASASASASASAAGADQEPPATPAAVAAEMRAVRRDEEARLTADLKEKVGLVEDQWVMALGKGLDECKRRIRADLEERGGWDESLQE